MCLTELIFFSIFSAALLAPPCAGFYSEAIPAAIQANGFAPEEPAVRTVEVEAFCLWLACRIKIRFIARFRIGLTLYGLHGVENIIFRKLLA